MLNFIGERLSVQGVIMGESSSFPHCKGVEGNSLCNEVIRHTVSQQLRWIFSRLSQTFELEDLCKFYRSHQTQTAKYSQKCSFSWEKALVSLRCDYFHTSALFGGHFFYKPGIEILKYRAVVVIVSVRQRSKGRIFVASTIYIWR